MYDNLESVVVIPPHGLQLETRRGISSAMQVLTSRKFIPAIYLQDFVINEGLRRWDVRYYLVAIHHCGRGEVKLDVAFEVWCSLQRPPFSFSEHLPEHLTSLLSAHGGISTCPE